MFYQYLADLLPAGCLGNVVAFLDIAVVLLVVVQMFPDFTNSIAGIHRHKVSAQCRVI
ncbi:hypothetical protein D3C80_2023440 [compost metagenome]